MRRLLLLVLLLSFGCTKKEQKLEYGLKLNETLRVNLMSEPPTADWHKSTDTTSSNVIDNIMDGLTELDLDDPEMKPIPALATEWSSTKDAKKWTFTLHQGVKWTDGVELEAQHFVDGWQRLLNPDTAAEYAYFLHSIKNAQAYTAGKVKDFSEVGVKALDKYKLEVTLERGVAFFPMLVSHVSTFPFRKDVFEKHGPAWTQPGNIVTLGAFTMKVWDHDKNMVLERNENYYGTKPWLKNVLAYMIVEHSTALSLFDGGRLDIIPEVPYTEIPRLRDRKEFNSSPELSTQYYGFNARTKPFDNPKVRKAIYMAVDRDELTKMHNVGHVAASTFVPQGMMSYDANLKISFDPAKSKELLKEAGYGDISKFPKFSIFYNTNENNKRTAENIQAQLKKNLGLEVELQNEDWKVYQGRLSRNCPPIWRLAWQADYPDPDNMLNLWLTQSGNNRGKWSNPKYDSVVEKAMAELDVEKRKILYAEAQQILQDEVPVMPWFYTRRQYMKSERVKNYKFNPLDKRIYKTVRLE